MSVTVFEEGDRFVYRTVKALITNPDNNWVNSYEFRAGISASEGALLDLGEVLVAFEAAFHYTTTIFNRLIISTWEADSVPYDPTSFVSVSLSSLGDVEQTSDALALDQTLSVARVATSGRFGHLFYRNCVAEEDVNAPAGKLVLDDRAAFQSRIDTALTASGLDEYIGSTGAGDLKMVMINADGTQQRDVTGLFVAGMASVKTDHKWFNRTTT